MHLAQRHTASCSADEPAGSLRSTVSEMLSFRERHQPFVQLNAFDTRLTVSDLAAVMAGHPDGIMLPKCEIAVGVIRLATLLDAFEAAFSPNAGATGIVSISTETARSLLGLSTYSEAGARLRAVKSGV